MVVVIVDMYCIIPPMVVHIYCIILHMVVPTVVDMHDIGVVSPTV